MKQRLEASAETLFPLNKLNRRNFLFATALAAGGVTGLAGEGFAETHELKVVKLEIPLERLPRSFDGFTIAQLSDFHYELFTAKPISQAVEMVNRLAPDLVALTGDFVTSPLFEGPRSLRKVAALAAPCAAILSKLRARYGVYAVLGNHDVASDSGRITRILADNEIPVLRNRAIALKRRADRIWLVGLDDAFIGRPDLGEALKEVPADEATILLAHEPDFADEAVLLPIDLQLSGHSHGGQVWIPGLGAPWLPPLARKYPRGLYRIRNLTLYTNIGIGTIHAPIRINCPPEITLIRLRALNS
ncbi:MAG: metallophosphoesterase [Acidobacteria bacterium]|nr:metallophosphoesterase [Acidobacteriota bacterium]